MINLYGWRCSQHVLFNTYGISDDNMPPGYALYSLTRHIWLYTYVVGFVHQQNVLFSTCGINDDSMSPGHALYSLTRQTP